MPAISCCKCLNCYTPRFMLSFLKRCQYFSELQENLIRSHAAGVGKPLTQEQTRMLVALRINVLAKGYR